MACLLDLSHELLQGIFSEVDGADLAALSATCRPFNSFIEGNALLCKSVYLRSWNYPSGPEPCWEKSLRDQISLQKLLECNNLEAKREELSWAASLIASLLKANNSQDNARFLADMFESQQNVDVFLASSSLFQSTGTESQKPASTAHQRQLAARLHCLYGVPIDCALPPALLREDSDMSPSPSSYAVLYPSNPNGESLQPPTNSYARAVVYDLRRYTTQSLWGPFRNDGSQRADWEKLEAIMIVLGYNMRMFHRKAPHVLDPTWTKPWAGSSPHSYISAPPTNLSRELSPPGDLEAQDPYGITGLWMRVVCFLDYHDLFEFNFGSIIPRDQPREPLDTREALRLIRLKLRVSSIEPPGPDDGQDYPVVSFTGTSWSLHASWDANANSQIRGVVRQTPEGEIRWTTWSIFHGEERWRSEGIQIGGIRSARGVLGNWFDKDYDRHGPAGPTAFWKVSDYIAEKDAETGATDDDDDDNANDSDSVFTDVSD